jgi:methionine-rich copper-binding protein CopC
MWATPDPFTSQIDVRFIGQINGNAKVDLLNVGGQIVATKSFATELEEVYNYSFTNLAALAAGTYTIKYSDSLKSRSIQLQKTATNNEWLIASPNPFRNSLFVYLKPVETGNASLRLIDAKGSKVDELSIAVVQGQAQTITFKNVPKLQRGIYLLQYISHTLKRTIKLVKL